MGIDLGALLQAGSTVAGGIAQGEQTRQERERRAMLDLLAQKLQESQAYTQQQNTASEIDNRRVMQKIAQQNADTREAALHRPHKPNARLVQDENNQWVWMEPPGATQPVRSLMPSDQAPTQQPASRPGVSPTGVRGPRRAAKMASSTRIPGYTFTLDGRAVVSSRAPDGTITQDTLPTGRVPTTQERQFGSQAPAAEDAATTLRRIATTDRNSANQAVAFLRAKHHVRLGGDLIAEARGKLSTPAAQEFVQAYNAYLLATIPNARPNQTTIDLESEASLPAIGAPDAAWEPALRMIDERVQALRIRGGRATPAQANRPPSRFMP